MITYLKKGRKTDMIPYKEMDPRKMNISVNMKKNMYLSL